jgi:hypothetical protein
MGNPHHLVSSISFMLLLVSFLCIFINLYEHQLQLDINAAKLTMLWHLKLGLVLAAMGEPYQSKTTLAADGVSR